MVNTSGRIERTKHIRSNQHFRLFYAFLALALLYVLLTGLIATLTKDTPLEKRIENEEWVASSRFWLDRQICRWVGCCGTFHMLNRAGWTSRDDDSQSPTRDYTDFWHAGKEVPGDWSQAERKLRTIPDYVFEYAPYVHLSSDEQYWPSDIAEHLVHVTPYINHTEILQLDQDLNLSNLNDLNNLQPGEYGKHIFLHSNDNMEAFPAWLSSAYNIPPHTMARCSDISNAVSTDAQCGGPCNVTCRGSDFGDCCSIYGYCGHDEDHCSDNCNPLFGRCHGPVMTGRYGPRLDLRKRTAYSGGRSQAPVLLIVVPKDNGIVDAFWFFFYSYNLGKSVLNIRFGNHIGDWEHTMVRFKDGIPIEMFLSAHSWGATYTYDVLEKYEPDLQHSGTMLSSLRNASESISYKRPVVYSAQGSHAMYPTPDYHSYVAPFGILHDDTDRGPLWDPTKNVKSFMYDINNEKLRSSTLNADAPTGWFDYAGHWGDRYYLLSDVRQYRFAGEYHYNSGPLGPKFKNLARQHSCIVPGECKVHTSIGHDPDDIHMLHEEYEASQDGD